MKKWWIIAVLALAVTGCTSEPVEPVTEPAPAETQVQEEPAAQKQAEAEPAPLKAAEEASPASPEDELIERLRKHADRPTIVNASDEELLRVARLACEQLEQNPMINELRLIEGEEPNDLGLYRDSMAIASNATATICPEIDTEFSNP